MAAIRPPAGAKAVAPESVSLAVAAEPEAEPEEVESAVEDAVLSLVTAARAVL